MAPDDTLTELQAWRLKLQHAEQRGNIDGADLCWRRLDWLLEKHWEQRDSVVPER